MNIYHKYQFTNPILFKSMGVRSIISQQIGLRLKMQALNALS
jgi:hypothetical protein